MDSNVSITVVRLSDSAEFHIDNVGWAIPSDGLDGFSGINSNITEDALLYDDGSEHEADKIEAKDRIVSCYVTDPHQNEELRHEAIAFFNVKQNYKLIIRYMGLERWCSGQLSQVKLSEGNIYKRVELMFCVHCFKPYLYSMDDFGQDIASVMPLAGFPYHARAEWGGHPVGYYNFSRSVKLYNDGDVSTKLRVILQTNGDVVNPAFYINDHYVRFVGKLSDGDKIEMNFEEIPPTVKKNGVNAMGQCDRRSQFADMILLKGNNTIRYAADTGDTFLTCSVYYNKRYLMI